MGVALGSILSSKEIDIQDLEDKKIALDAYNIIYQFLASIRQRDGKPLTDSQGNVTSHLSGLLYRNANFLMGRLKPIYVLDGEPDTMKEGTLEKRKMRKEEAEKEYEIALEEGDIERARTKAQQTSRMSKDIVQSSKKLLELMGIPWVQAPAEGEAQAAYMVIKGDAWTVGSQDFDSLLCGAPRLVRNLTITGKRKMPGRKEYKDIVPEIIVLDKALDELNITREQLVDIALLCGTDYNEGIKGIGPKRGLKKVKKMGNLKEVLKDEEKNIGNYPAIKKLFLEPTVSDDYRVSFCEPDVKGMIDFLCGERDFSESRVRDLMDKIMNSGGKEKQADLFSFG
ncbi:MAG: flap endonuclease-1 [Thermoplasmata archaeon]